MADKLYAKIDGKIVAVNIEGTVGGGSGGISRKVLYSTSRASTLAAGTAFEVPEYVLGDNSLEVFLNGVRLSKGVEYAEASTTTVAFTSAIPPTYEITAVSYAGADAGTRAVQTDESRSAVIAAGTAYSVPQYVLGAGKLTVYLGGVKCEEFQESTTTAIIFTSAIPADMPIVVVVEA